MASEAITAGYFDGNESTDESTFDAAYREAEQSFRENATSFFREHENLLAEVRGRLDLEQEEREDLYLERYEALNQRFEREASTFVGQQANRLGQAARTLQQGTGARFGEYLLAAASTPEDGLATLLATAQRTGEKDLARAVAQTALDRRKLDVFNKWAASEPGLAEAMRVVRGIPTVERIATRTNAARPPRARADQLRPGPKEREQSAEEERIAKFRRRQALQHGTPGGGAQRSTDNFGNTYIGR